MKYMIYLAVLAIFSTAIIVSRRRRHPPQISLLVPFRARKSQPFRALVWAWLLAYWFWELPDAEIVMGRSSGKVFSKAEAVNNAASKANGRVFVILDADVYFNGSVIQSCADRIDSAIRHHKRLWFIPYRHLYRLNEEATLRVLESDPREPERFPSPPLSEDVEGIEGSMHGHRYGAMIQIMPREAFELVDGMDERFRGWGGEDVAFVRKVDSLYNRHKTTNNDVLHLWHPKIGGSHRTKMWEGQDKPRINEQLASRYSTAYGNIDKMLDLVEESKKSIPWWKKVWRWVKRICIRIKNVIF